jgi:hypothetical protein
MEPCPERENTHYLADDGVYRPLPKYEGFLHPFRRLRPVDDSKRQHGEYRAVDGKIIFVPCDPEKRPS